jgi:hypothetical protein
MPEKTGDMIPMFMRDDQKIETAAAGLGDILRDLFGSGFRIGATQQQPAIDEDVGFSIACLKADEKAVTKQAPKRLVTAPVLGASARYIRI